ncbi:hypothetical protein DOTSEDRAFT_73312 [Dothistroma septosporum NZE10]|uniref:Integral membrane bound transporter domain-containing protein n=1 Tax=Dothistroma septosporum (strain NZE10 / CBS 128990) TaxID=675120 RepID=N1PJ66_DOTSN|nr:hypothetical protein DOTSEDRAFT_73312 [Dothistroma septosporum NZE10]
MKARVDEMADGSTNGGGGGGGGANNTPTRFGRKLRRATFVVPRTGERSRRQFTLRDASRRLTAKSRRASASDDEQEPFFANGHFGWHDRDKPFAARIWDASRRRVIQAWDFALSPTGQGIFKCSIGYVLGSMATLDYAFAGLFGSRQDSKHQVATTVVYFHPARTLGSMHEATIIAFVAFLYAAFLSLCSMGLSIFFAQYDLMALGHAIVLIFFIGGGFGFMAYVKQKLGNPLVNVGASLASLSSISVLIREGSVQAGAFSMYKVTQQLGMTIVGIAIAAAVNFAILPTLARKKLSVEMEKNTDLLGEMLISITRAFLHGREGDLTDDYYKTLAKEHQASLNAMKKSLNEAKKEHYILGAEHVYAAEARIVDSLHGLAADLGGLRSAAMAQFAFLNQEIPIGGGASPLPAPQQWIASPPATPAAHEHEPQQYFGNLDVIRESPEERNDPMNGTADQKSTKNASASISRKHSMDFATETGTATPMSVKSAIEHLTPQTRESLVSANIAKSPGDMFIAFISQLGPPTKSLVFTVKQILDEMPFKEAAPSHNPWAARELEVAVNDQFHQSLRQAVDLYRENRKEALGTLYENRAINAAINAQLGTKSTFSTRTPTASAPGSPMETRHKAQSPVKSKTLFDRRPEEVLADIEEVTACCGHFSFSLLDFAEDVLRYLDVLDDLKAEMESQKRSWNWLLFWRRREPQRSPAIRTKTLPESSEDPDAGIPSPIKKADNVARGLTNSARKQPWYTKFYRSIRWLRRDDVKFGIKVGLGAALFALPAFLPDTRATFLHWRMEWGLVSFMVVCSMTVGAVNTTGFNRIIGTIAGALCAVVAWLLSNHHGIANPWLLGFFGWAMSLVGFYIIVAKDNGPMGRFIFLSYNLTALYSYSLSTHDDDNDDDEGGIDPAIWEIALHRVTAVAVGSIWGIIVCRWIAPISARHKLREGLSLLWLRMGLIWKRDPLALFLLGEPASSYMDIREEADLQAFLGSLKSLRKAASQEFEMQGPFPDRPVGRMLDCASRMMDAFHAMNVVISKNPQCTPGEAAVLRYTRPERFALSARISHLFTVLASSIKLEYPLSDALPDITDRRDKLLAKISEFRRTGDGRDLTTEQDYEMLYAYVLVTGQLAQDIQAVGAEIETLYGTLNEENLRFH